VCFVSYSVLGDANFAFLSCTTLVTNYVYNKVDGLGITYDCGAFA
jgi:hypothetical protein